MHLSKLPLSLKKTKQWSLSVSFSLILTEENATGLVEHRHKYSLTSLPWNQMCMYVRVTVLPKGFIFVSYALMHLKDFQHLLSPVTLVQKHFTQREPVWTGMHMVSSKQGSPLDSVALGERARAERYLLSSSSNTFHWLFQPPVLCSPIHAGWMMMMTSFLTVLVWLCVWLSLCALDQFHFCLMNSQERV